ncbi:MAG: hypothetical protein J6Y78_06695 [Paludibacteraceae bacterium]|nr:hypothetical protein [Paludibacteraceae bacterium]
MAQEVDYKLLISKLIELTNQDKCDWKESSEVNRYKYYNNGNNIVVSHSNSILGEVYHFEIYDFQDERLIAKRGTINEQDYTIIKNLYDAVKNFRERYVNKQMADIYHNLNKL